MELVLQYYDNEDLEKFKKILEKDNINFEADDDELHIYKLIKFGASHIGATYYIEFINENGNNKYYDIRESEICRLFIEESW